MFGGFIGQFLPVTGGTMLGDLSLGSSNLKVTHVQSTDGITRLQFSAGSNSPAVLLDDHGNQLVQWDENGLTLLNSSSINFDSVASVSADGSGNISFDATSTSFQGPLTISGGGLTVGGPATLVTTTVNSTITAKIFKSSSFTAAQLIFVDGTNGNNVNGNGSPQSPFATIGHATSIATSGNCIFAMPGTYNEEVTLPNGVSLVGSGPGVTTISYSGTLTTSNVLAPGTGSYVANLTVLRPRASGGASGGAVGFNTGAGTPAQNARFFNVVFSGDFDNIYCFAPSQPTYTAQGNWISGTAYSANQWVLYGATPYLCTTGLTSTTIPPEDTSHWTPLVYWTFRNCTFQSSWDCTNFSYPMFCDFFDCFFDQGPNPFGYNAIGSALQPGNPNCRIRSIGCHIRQVATSTAGGGTAFNATSGGQIEVHDTSVVTINQNGTAVMNAIQVNASGQVVKIGGGCSFDVSAYSQSGGGIIQGIASGAMFPTNSNPKDSTPANRPPGVIGSIAIYSGNFYLCTNESTPTWVEITTS